MEIEVTQQDIREFCIRRQQGGTGVMTTSNTFKSYFLISNDVFKYFLFKLLLRSDPF